MKLSRTVSYAVRATLQLARDNSSTPVPCSKLAAEGHMPERFLLQILRSLVTHGILRSTRGVDGGYALVRSPDELSLLDIIEAIDGPVEASLETPAGSPDDDMAARLQDALKHVADSNRRLLASIKFSQLLANPLVELEMPDSNELSNEWRERPERSS